MHLNVRPWTADDIPEIVRYWTTLSPEDAARMGADWSRIPSPEAYAATLQAQLLSPPETTTAFYSMWVVGEETIGYSSLKDIEFGVRGSMHLHIWTPSYRNKGLGSILFCMSALDFYERFQVAEIVCEPSAANPGPNRMLIRIGFPLSGWRVGRSSEIALVTRVNTYSIQRDIAKTYLARYAP